MSNGLLPGDWVYYRGCETASQVVRVLGDGRVEVRREGWPQNRTRIIQRPENLVREIESVTITQS